jgi:uncharacterized protein DUF5659
MEKPPEVPNRETRISDLDLAALLIAEGLALVRVESSPDPRRKLFVITGDGEQADRLQTAFNRCEATVNVTAFVAARRRLRSALVREGQR